jgi:SGNH hydrolase-like domain, acetyltransferase AlgX
VLRSDSRKAGSQVAGPRSARSRPEPPKPARSSRWPIILGRLAAIVCGILAPLLAFEVILRLGGAIAPGEYQTVDLNAVSEQFGRVNMANRAGAKKTSEFSTHVRLNSHGLRGPEIPYAKPDGTYRVLVVGDSFTFGAQVEEDETFVARLGEHLRAASDRRGLDAVEFETINGGVDGWNTYNELAWLTAEGVRYEPDLVVLMYYTGNDPGENFDWMKALNRRDADAAPAPTSTMQELRKSLARWSALYALIESGVVAKLAPAPAPAEADAAPLKVRRSIDPDRKDRGWEISGDLMRQMRELCDDRGIRLMVVGIPTLENVLEDDRPSTPFLDVTQGAGTPAVDLLEPFRATSSAFRETLYFPKDRHWTATGHELAAEHVADALLDGETLASIARTR